MADSIKASLDSVKTLQDSVKAFNRNQRLVLMSNDTLSIEFTGKELFLEVWDGGILDNDMISIYLNGEILKKEITLTGKKETIELPVSNNNFKLKIVALNTGNLGMNTVSFAVKDTHDVIKGFGSRLNKGESFDVEFIRKR